MRRPFRLANFDDARVNFTENTKINRYRPDFSFRRPEMMEAQNRWMLRAHYLGNRFLSIFIRLTLHHLLYIYRREDGENAGKLRVENKKRNIASSCVLFCREVEITWNVPR